MQALDADLNELRFPVDAHHPDAQTSASPAAASTANQADKPITAAAAPQLLDNAKRLLEDAQDIAGASAESERQRLL